MKDSGGEHVFNITRTHAAGNIIHNCIYLKKSHMNQGCDLCFNI